MTGARRDARSASRIAAIALSAFLLFTLELYAGRVVLPAFGGSPSVWTTTLCFFTGVVFLGYLYAHVLTSRLNQRTAGMVHLLVALAAVAATVLAPDDLGALRLAGVPPALNVLAVLTVIVGVPAFLLSSTTPLVSARVAASGEDPWWLYAASNAASLGGLLAYPLFIEPSLPLSLQKVGITALLLVLVALLGLTLRGTPDPPPVTAPANPNVRPSHRRELVWLLAAFMPAGLLSATTTLLTTDHASAPLLWVGPLGVYLGSFVVAFSDRGRRVLPLTQRLVPAATTLLWVAYIARVDWPFMVIVPTVLLSYTVLAIAVHGHLAMDRPEEAHLTRFYLLLSAGGGLATAFVALLAPIVFEDVYEYPLLLVGALAALALLVRRLDGRPAPGEVVREAAARLLPLAVAGSLVAAALVSAPGSGGVLVGVLLLLGGVAVMLGTSPRAFTLTTSITIALALLVFAPHPAERVRSFFGVTDVIEAADGAAFAEIHGTTLHGLQYRDERSADPTAYFVHEGPLGDVFAALQQTHPDGAAIGVVGLGVGTIAAYARPVDSLTYFEIDPVIVEIARDRRYFTYLADAAVEPEILLGDGRLLLEDVPDARFDLLILDAFSSDSVPTHLLTAEAMTTYRRALRPGGLVAFQLTNRHFALEGAVAETARAVGLDALMLSFEPAEAGDLTALPSTWLVAGEAGDLKHLEASGWKRVGGGPVLTDDYADVTRLMKNVWRPAERPSI